MGVHASRTKDSTLALARGRADEPQAGERGQRSRWRRSSSVVFVGGDAPHVPGRLQEVDGRAQADGAGDVRRAGLELVGERVVDGLLEGDRERSCRRRPGRAASPRAARLAVEHADAGGPVHLVAREGVEVAVQRLHVDVEVRGGLGAVDQHGSAPGVGDRRMMRRIGLIVPSALETWVTATSFVRGPMSAFELVEQQLAGVV